MSIPRSVRRTSAVLLLPLLASVLLGTRSGADASVQAAPGSETIGTAISPADLTSLSWVAKQEPVVGRITTLPSASTLPGGSAVSGKILRTELRPGETYTGDGTVTSRAEVYGRIPKIRTTPAAQWQDPPDSERWYDFKVLFPSEFPVATDTRWLTFTQWKGLLGGSPPVALEVKRSGLRLGGTRTNAGLVPLDGQLGPISFGAWTRLTVGIKWSNDSSVGWVQVYRDGVEVLPRTPLATMDTINGGPDPIYLKQGLYRSTSWTSTQYLYFSPVEVTATRPSEIL